jgi:hypothetical protein
MPLLNFIPLLEESSNITPNIISISIAISTVSPLLALTPN